MLDSMSVQQNPPERETVQDIYQTQAEQAEHEQKSSFACSQLMNLSRPQPVCFTQPYRVWLVHIKLLLFKANINCKAWA